LAPGGARKHVVAPLGRRRGGAWAAAGAADAADGADSGLRRRLGFPATCGLVCLGPKPRVLGRPVSAAALHGTFRFRGPDAGLVRF